MYYIPLHTCLILLTLRMLGYFILGSQIFDSQFKLEENISNWVVSTVPVDGLAPLGARPSAGTVLTKYGSNTHMVPALQGTLNIMIGRMLNVQHLNLFGTLTCRNNYLKATIQILTAYVIQVLFILLHGHINQSKYVYNRLTDTATPSQTFYFISFIMVLHWMKCQSQLAEIQHHSHWIVFLKWNCIIKEWDFEWDTYWNDDFYNGCYQLQTIFNWCWFILSH